MIMQCAATHDDDAREIGGLKGLGTKADFAY
jgi:hypothetical protein